MSAPTALAPSPAAWTTIPAVVCGTNSVTNEPSALSIAAPRRSVTSSSCVLRWVAKVSSSTRSFSRELIGKGDELGRAQLLGSCPRFAADRLERRGCPVARGEAGELERVRQALAAVREGRGDGSPDLCERRRQRAAAKRDERRVDVRLRSEDRPRDRVKAGALGRELHEHGDRAIGLRRGPGKETVGDLALDHHAPELDAREAVEAFDH